MRKGSYKNRPFLNLQAERVELQKEHIKDTLVATLELSSPGRGG